MKRNIIEFEQNNYFKKIFFPLFSFFSCKRLICILQGEDDEYGVQDNPPIIDTLFVKNKQPDCPPPPPPPSGKPFSFPTNSFY